MAYTTQDGIWTKAADDGWTAEISTLQGNGLIGKYVSTPIGLVMRECFEAHFNHEWELESYSHYDQESGMTITIWND